MAIMAMVSLQKALYARLSGDGTLMGKISGAYDFTPQQAVFPYLMIGDGKAQDWSSKTAKGVQLQFDISVFSREGGKKQTQDILSRVYTLLHNANFSVDDFTLISLRLAASEIEQLDDGLTYQGVMHFIARLQEA